MKVLIRQFLGKNHSWSVCGWGISRALKQLGHDVHLFSTDGIEHLPTDLKENLIGYVDGNIIPLVGKLPDSQYDCQISYTAMRNFPHYLGNGNKNRFGIWCYEWAGKNVLPAGFAKKYKFCDFLCAPSNFARTVFLDSGIPDTAIKVIPHGIDKSNYEQTSVISLPTNKNFKILANIAQNHLRKNIPGLLEAYGKAFSKNDDVCLILKGQNNIVKSQFEISIGDCIKAFKEKFPNHAEFILYKEFIPDISSLYRSVDALYSLSHCEGFLFPALEILAVGKLAIASNWGGQLDFLNDNNSLLVSGKEVRANPKSMYWEPKTNAIWFEPSIDDAVEKLRYAYKNFETMNTKIKEQSANILQQYSWKTVTEKFLQLAT